MPQRNTHLLVDKDDGISLNIHVFNTDEMVALDLGLMNGIPIRSITCFDSNKTTSMESSYPMTAGPAWSRVMIS